MTGSPAFIVPLFLSLGLDTFAVAVGLGLSGLDRPQRLRYGLSFALAEGLMPLIGLLAGRALAAGLGDLAQYLAAALLLVVGLYTIREVREGEERPYAGGQGTRPVQLLLTSLSISLDELAVGFSLGLLHVSIPLAVAYIAVQAFVLTLVGTSLGGLAGEALAGRAELLSGVVLSLLGLALLGKAVLGG